ncbi:hypothetical protein H6F90_22250 [Trichocoleus sp. FACHB-591]|nr:hypothetical protein [Trichocoleus sp. FACHB-591]MBD2097799.1 hypothetical protein [Trichocoleus sp. FACHB-591]
MNQPQNQSLFLHHSALINQLYYQIAKILGVIFGVFDELLGVELRTNH